jgi:hypothetical protein
VPHFRDSETANNGQMAFAGGGFRSLQRLRRKVGGFSRSLWMEDPIRRAGRRNSVCWWLVVLAGLACARGLAIRWFRRAWT